MTHNTPERNSLIQNSVMKVRSGTEPSMCLPLLTFLMFRKIVEKGGLHSEDLLLIGRISFLYEILNFRVSVL